MNRVRSGDRCSTKRWNWNCDPNQPHRIKQRHFGLLQLVTTPHILARQRWLPRIQHLIYENRSKKNWEWFIVQNGFDCSEWGGVVESIPCYYCRHWILEIRLILHKAFFWSHSVMACACACDKLSILANRVFCYGIDSESFLAKRRFRKISVSVSTSRDAPAWILENINSRCWPWQLVQTQVWAQRKKQPGSASSGKLPHVSTCCQTCGNRHHHHHHRQQHPNRIAWFHQKVPSLAPICSSVVWT